MATLVAALIALALPALASARPSKSTATATKLRPRWEQSATPARRPPNTALRAAIEAADEDATPDVIKFEPAKFQGVGGNGTVTLTEGLPEPAL